MRFSIHLCYLTIIFACLLSIGCLNLPPVIQTYQGLPLERSQHAILETNADICQFGVAEVDGKPVLAYCKNMIIAGGITKIPISLLPTMHTIRLSYTNTSIIGSYTTEGNLNFTPEAGRTYIAQFRGDGYSFVHFWIEEKSTRKVISQLKIAGKIPTKTYHY